MDYCRMQLRKVFNKKSEEQLEIENERARIELSKILRFLSQKHSQDSLDPLHIFPASLEGKGSDARHRTMIKLIHEQAQLAGVTTMKSWVKLDISKNDLVKDTIGQGLMRLLSQIKLAIFVLSIVFIMYLSEIVSNPPAFCNLLTDINCQSSIMFGLKILDFKRIKNVEIDNLAYIFWAVVGVMFRALDRYKRSQNQGNVKYTQPKSNLLLCDFPPELSREEIEFTLNEKLSMLLFDKGYNLPFDSEPMIRLVDCFSVPDEFRVVSLLKKSNKLLEEILEEIQNAREIQQQLDEVQKFEEIKAKEDHNNSEQSQGIINSKNDQNQQIFSEEQKEVIPDPMEILHSESRHFSEMKKPLEEPLLFQQKRESIVQEVNNPPILHQLESINDSQQENAKKSKNNSIRSESRGLSDWKNEQFPMTESLKKVLLKYEITKEKIVTRLSSESNLKSTTYLVNCRSPTEEQLTRLALKNQRSSFFQFFKNIAFIMCPRSNWLYRARYARNDVKDFNWKTMGIGMRSKTLRILSVRLIGMAQFWFTTTALIFLGGTNLDIQQSSDESTFNKYLYKFSLSISQTALFLVNEKIYEIYAKFLIGDLHSNEAILHIDNFFLFYAVTYIYMSYFGIFIFVFTVPSLEEGINNLGYSPFKLFIQNTIIAIVLFTVKAIFPTSMIWSKIKQSWYIRRQKWNRVTQQKLNRVFGLDIPKLKIQAMAVYGIIIVSIPLTYSFPLLLLVPICSLVILMFALKYECLHVYATKFESAILHKYASRKLFSYVRYVNIASFWMFAQSAEPFLFGSQVHMCMYGFELLWYFFRLFQKSRKKTVLLQQQMFHMNNHHRNQNLNRNNIFYIHDSILVNPDGASSMKQVDDNLEKLINPNSMIDSYFIFKNEITSQMKLHNL